MCIRDRSDSCRDSLCRVVFCVLECPDLGEAPHMALLSGEACADEGVGEVACHFTTDDPAAEDQDVHVVVFDTLASRVGVVCESCTDTTEFVRSDRGSDAAATYDDATFGQSVEHRPPGRFGEVRIVDRFRAVRAEVEDNVPFPFEMGHEVVLHHIACVICCECELHGQAFLTSAAARSATASTVKPNS